MALVTFELSDFSVTPDYDDWVSTDFQVADNINFVNPLVNQSGITDPGAVYTADVVIETFYFARVRYNGLHGTTGWSKPHIFKVNADLHQLLHVKGSGPYDIKPAITVDSTGNMYYATLVYNGSNQIEGIGLVKMNTLGELVASTKLVLTTTSFFELELTCCEDTLLMMYRYHNGTRAVLAVSRWSTALSLLGTQILNITTGSFVSIKFSKCTHTQVGIQYQHGAIAPTQALHVFNKDGYVSHFTSNMNGGFATAIQSHYRETVGKYLMTCVVSTNLQWYTKDNSTAHRIAVGATQGTAVQYNATSGDEYLFIAHTNVPNRFTVVAIDLSNNTVAWVKQYAMAISVASAPIFCTTNEDVVTVFIRTGLDIFIVQVGFADGALVNAVMFRSRDYTLGSNQLGDPEQQGTRLYTPFQGINTYYGNGILNLDEALFSDIIPEYDGSYSLITVVPQVTTPSTPSITSVSVTNPSHSVSWTTQSMSTDTWLPAVKVTLI